MVYSNEYINITRINMRLILHFLLLVTLFLSAAYSEDSVSADAVEAVEPAKENPYIAISDIPEQANSTLLKLQEIGELLTEKEDVIEMNISLPSYIESLQAMLDDPVYKHLDTQDLKTIDELNQKWDIYLKQLEEWQAVLKARLELYDEYHVTLKKLTELWSETHINADKKQAPEAIQNHIASVLIKIETLNNKTKANYDMLLTNSQLIADKILKINVKKNQLLNARSELLSNIFVVDAAPITAMIRTTPLNFFEYIHDGRDYVKSFYQNVTIYFTNHVHELYELFIYIFLISAMMGHIYFLNRKDALFTQGEQDTDHRFAFIKRPFSTIAVLTVFAATFVFSDRSLEFKYLQVFILIIPLVRLLRNIVDRHFMPYIYIFFILYVVEFFELGITTYGLMERLSALALIASMFTIVCLAQREKKNIINGQLSSLFRYSTKFLFLLCILLGIAFIANAYGTVALSERITSVAITTLAAILMFYVLANILSGLITIFIRRRIVNAHHLIQQERAYKLERNVVGLITLAMFAWWGLMMVNIFGAKEMLLEWTDSILAYSWKFGDLTFSVQSIFNFFIILVITWLIARLVRIILELEVFMRFKLPRGVPTAIATMSNHTIYFIGIVAALSTLGVTMQEFALIGGALGVGIGFGIRNIVANFISGIIMLFERPVQIGDTIEINNTMGKVQTIGSRATSIKTFDGSEVLIPNADFISADVTNWTLSDERRRAALLIKVDFDSDIEKVLELMSGVAETHEHVLKDPKPMATFQGFGDYYLEFKLYYWLSTEIIRTKSDVAIGVYKSLRENGIKIPTPTRSIAIHKEDGEV